MSIKYKFMILSALLCFITLSSCITDVLEPAPDESAYILKYDLTTIASSDHHIGFPKLIFYKNAWYIAYRDADSHINMNNDSTIFSKIVVLKSSDFKNWKIINIFESEKGWDYRGGIISYDETRDSLYLHIPIVSSGTSSSKYGKYVRNMYTIFDQKNNKFNNKLSIQSSPSDYPLTYLYYPIWKKGEMYVTGYAGGGGPKVRYYKYTSLNKSPICFATIQGTTEGEADMYFYKDSVYTLVRSQNNAIFGRLKLSATELTKLKTNSDYKFECLFFPSYAQIGGPKFEIYNDTVYISGRESWSKMPFYKMGLNDNRLKLIDYLPVYGWDNAYPGTYLKNDTIFGTYYTQKSDKNGYEIRTFKLPILSQNKKK